jgi:hypothetical protein
MLCKTCHANEADTPAGECIVCTRDRLADPPAPRQDRRGGRQWSRRAQDARRRAARARPRQAAAMMRDWQAPPGTEADVPDEPLLSDVL